MKISESIKDNDISGEELLPLSDNEAPKHTSLMDVAEFVKKTMAGSPSATIDTAKGFYVFVDDGSLHFVSPAALSQHILKKGLSIEAATGVEADDAVVLARADKFVRLDFDTLKTAINDGVTAGLDFAALDPSDPLAETNLVVVNQTTNKKTTLGSLRSFVLSGLASYVSSHASSVPADTDVLIVSSGASLRKYTLADLKAALGDVRSPATTTEGNIPVWGSGNKALTDGMGVARSLAPAASASDAKIPTEAAVRGAIDTATEEMRTEMGGDNIATTPANKTSGKLAKFGDAQELAEGPGVRTDVRDAVLAENADLPTEKAVRVAIDAAVEAGIADRPTASEMDAAIDEAVTNVEGLKAPLSTTEGNIPKWNSQGGLDDGYTPSATISPANAASDEKIPTEKATRTAIEVVNSKFDSKRIDDFQPGRAGVTRGDATQDKHGFMSAVDKVKLDNLEDSSSATDMSEDIADTDTLLVRDISLSKTVKAAFSRVWSYIEAKVKAIAVDGFAAPTDIATHNVSTTAHGFAPKLSGNASQYLDGTGHYTSPGNATPFQGATETEEGTQGLVPKPLAIDSDKFLKANGDWADVPGPAAMDIPAKPAIDIVAAADLLQGYQASTNEYKRITAAQMAAYSNSVARYDTIFVPAGAIVPSNENGAIAEQLYMAANKSTRDVIRFGITKDTFADFELMFPDDWDRSSLKAKILWTPANSDGAAGQVVRFTLKAAFVGDGEAITGIAGADTIIDDTMSAVQQLHVTEPTSNIAIGGTPLVGKTVHFWISRDFDYSVGFDAVARGTCACVLGIVFQFGRSTTTEAW